VAELKETLLERREVFRGRVLTLFLDRVRLPDGREATREVLRHPGAVAVVAQRDDGRVVLVRQFRHAVGQELLELPAGKLGPGEDPLDCARRELEEETGYRAGRWERLGSFLTSPGFTDEIMHLFLARELVPGWHRPDDDEFLEVVEADPAELLRTGGILDGKSILGLLLLGRS
jgi:ADP-ribose pyrophosphatase